MKILGLLKFLRIKAWALILLAAIAGCSASGSFPRTKESISQSAIGSNTVHLVLGNPSNATTGNANNYLMVKLQYVLSYNRSKGIPNWVSWQLNASWLGNAPRQNNFRPDPTLPEGWYRVRPSDYTGSGYDKGHMTPSADRSKSLSEK